MNPTGSQNDLSVHCLGRDLSPQPSAPEAAVLPIRLWGIRNVHIIAAGSQTEKGQMSELEADESRRP